MSNNLKSLKKLSGLIVLFCSLILICLITKKAAHASASIVSQEFNGNGEVIYISPSSLTVVVDVVEGAHTRIIAGKISSDAIIRQNDVPSNLNNFKVGDNVRIVWKETIYGKEVLALLSNPRPIQPRLAPPIGMANNNSRSTKTPPLIAPLTPQSLESTITAQPTHKRIQTHQESPTSTLIGSPVHHVIAKDETLLDIARNYNLGFNELTNMHPDIDPWLPPVGKKILLPTQRLLPDGPRKGILINIPELRLYYFTRKAKAPIVTTYPVGVGDIDFETPSGKYVIGNKSVHPTWYIPASLQDKYKVKTIPPGPDNPLGKFWMGFKGTSYGIHGTDIPWSIGRLVTHGCIRMYPEDIKIFFPIIGVGTPVLTIYEPVKIAEIGGDYYLEVHHDVYGKIDDLHAYAKNKAIEMGIWQRIDHKLFTQTVEKKSGYPVKITPSSQASTNMHSKDIQLPVFVSGTNL